MDSSQGMLLHIVDGSTTLVNAIKIFEYRNFQKPIFQVILDAKLWHVIGTMAIITNHEIIQKE